MSRTAFQSHPPASVAGKVAATLFLIVAAFQVALAAGAPWGEVAFGGVNPGVLPDSLRASSAIGVIVYLLLASISGTRWAGVALRRRVLYGAAAVMVVGAMMNVASPSFVERMLWTPVSVALVVTLWRAARHASLLSPSQSLVNARRPV